MDQALKLWEERMRAAIKEGREGIFMKTWKMMYKKIKMTSICALETCF